jgi:AcrR family transcriptional regulator
MILNQGILELKRNNIALAVLEDFKKNMKGEINLNLVIKTLKISKKTFYKYFKNKTELILVIENLLYDKFLLPEVIDISGKNGYEKFITFVQKRVRVFLEHYEIILLGFNHLAYFKEADEFFTKDSIFYEMKEKTFVKAYKYFAEGVEDGSIKQVPGMNPDIIFHSLMGMEFYYATSKENNDPIITRYETNINNYINLVTNLLKN